MAQHHPHHPHLRRQNAEQIIARLESALEERGQGVLASDADHTIWDGDVGLELFEAVIEEKAVREAARDALAKEAASIGLSADKSENDLAAALYEAYKDGRYPDDRAFIMMCWIFAGFSSDEMDDFASRVLDRGSIETRFRPGMRAIFEWAERRAVAIYVVSASPIAIVRQGIARLGINPRAILAMTPAISPSGTILPQIDGPSIYGEGKVKALQSAEAGPLLGAFGDSAFDAAMLRIAHVPVAVSPSDGLAAIAFTIDGLVALDA